MIKYSNIQIWKNKTTGEIRQLSSDDLEEPDFVSSSWIRLEEEEEKLAEKLKNET